MTTSRPTPPSALPVERVRDQHPDDEAWRGDALGGSRHARLVDELRQPLEDHDVERAREICGEVCRAVLRDFAPALILLPSDARRRAQALATYVVTLFDFARQSGVEGERLSAINRWEFALDATLAGQPPGQPAFVLMAQTGTDAPWPVEALDRLAGLARTRAVESRPTTVAQAERRSRELAAALAEALTGVEVDEAVVELLAAVVRTHGVITLGEGVRRSAPALARDELPDAWSTPGGERSDGAALREAVEREIERLTPTLERGRATAKRAPTGYRRTTLYLALAAGRLLEEAAAAGERLVDGPPEIPALARLGFVARARLSRA